MSNLIKSSNVISLEQLKQLQWFHPQTGVSQEEPPEPPAEPVPDQETISLRDRIMEDAQAFAKQTLQEAAQESEQMLAEARREIEQWWLDKRAEDEAAAETARVNGYNEGYALGAAEAEAQLRAEWQAKLDEAAQVLKQAYAAREQIIQESEPFLVELSCAVAEKVIGQQLEQAPRMAIELIRSSLSRRREQGVITLCVAPSQLGFVQAAREELHAAIDSQAELQILPDSTVQNYGCVIRSAFGSIDTRIDTQLAEIKRELIGLCHQSAQERGRADERE